MEFIAPMSRTPGTRRIRSSRFRKNSNPRGDPGIGTREAVRWRPRVGRPEAGIRAGNSHQVSDEHACPDQKRQGQGHLGNHEQRLRPGLPASSRLGASFTESAPVASRADSKAEGPARSADTRANPTAKSQHRDAESDVGFSRDHFRGNQRQQKTESPAIAVPASAEPKAMGMTSPRSWRTR